MSRHRQRTNQHGNPRTASAVTDNKANRIKDDNPANIKHGAASNIEQNGNDGTS